VQNKILTKISKVQEYFNEILTGRITLKQQVPEWSDMM
jgi:hypothetical protein